MRPRCKGKGDAMASTFNKTRFALDALAVLLLGFIPGKALKSGALVVASVVAAAVILHFLAP
jgi:hypothetical protein